MIPFIVIAGGPSSREGLSREHISPSRPMLAAQHSFIRRSVALPHDLRSLISSGVGDRRQVHFDIRNLELVQVRSPFKFLRAVSVARHLISIGFHRALQVLQDALRDCADPFHFSPFARSMGLADLLYGQQQIRRKLKCPTKALKGETR